MYVLHLRLITSRNLFKFPAVDGWIDIHQCSVRLSRSLARHSLGARACAATVPRAGVAALAAMMVALARRNLAASTRPSRTSSLEQYHVSGVQGNEMQPRDMPSRVAASPPENVISLSVGDKVSCEKRVRTRAAICRSSQEESSTYAQMLFSSSASPTLSFDRSPFRYSREDARRELFDLVR